MKINIGKTEVFAENIKNTSYKLDEIEEELHRIKIKLSDNQTEVDGIVTHISKIEDYIENSLYTLLKMSIAVQRISDIFITTEKNIERRLEEKPAKKNTEPKIEFIKINNIDIFQGIMNNVEDN